MINRLATRTSRLALFLVTMLGLAACGGGGGGGGDDGGFLGPGFEDTDTFFLKITLLDPSGNATNTISTAEPATLEAVVTKNKASGAPQNDVIVNVSANVDVLINGAGGAAEGLTNADGIANFRIEAGPAKGAGTLTVSVIDENGATVEKTINFQLGASGLRLGYLANGSFVEGQIQIIPAGTVSARGQAEISVVVVDENGDLVESAESIAFRSACLSGGDATLDPVSPIETITGQVSTLYMPTGCVGSDTITASLVGSNATASGVIDVAAPSANSLSFQSTEPNLIVLKGTGGGGGRVEQSTVTFATTDANGQPLPDVEVQFSLTTEVGGITLTPTSAISDSDGLVSTVVTSGNVATVVRVLAKAPSADGTGEVSAVSDLLTISTGLPDQNSISVGVVDSFISPFAMNTDGETRTIVVRLADKFNNPVPDGTSALFTTEYGSIQPSCETVGGACQVTWTSQEPRIPTLRENQDLVIGLSGNSSGSCPSHNGPAIPCPAGTNGMALGQIYGGRSTILVTAIGEESFVDRNGNGIYDQAEANAGLFANLTEAFLDQNENGLFDPASQACASAPNSLECMAGSEETFVDFDSDNRFDANGDDPANGYPDQGQTAVYNGLLCPEEGDGIWCSRELVNVFASTVVILSDGPNYRMGLYSGRSQISGINQDGTFTVYTSDTFNNQPPAGSTIQVSAPSGICSASINGDSTVPNSAARGAFTTSFTVTRDSLEYDSCSEDRPESTGDLIITLNAAGGSSFSQTYTCTATVVDTGANPCPP